MASKGRPSEDHTAIYALSAQDGAIRYVGKADDPQKRLQQHRGLSKAPRTPLHSWLRREIAAGRDVACRVLEWVPKAEWQDAERRLISQYRCSGALLNIQDGGDQPQRSNDPIAKRVWLLKKQLRSGLRSGLVNEDTKNKLRALAAQSPDRFGEWAAI